MALRKVFESEPIPYTLSPFDGRGAVSVFGAQSPFVYHPGLPFAVALASNGLQGLYLVRDTRSSAGYAVRSLNRYDQKWWPSWGGYLGCWDAGTGAWIAPGQATTPEGWTYWPAYVTSASEDGTLYYQDAWGAVWEGTDASRYVNFDGKLVLDVKILKQAAPLSPGYGQGFLRAPFLVDKARDVAVCAAADARSIEVWEDLAGTPTLARTLPVHGTIVDLFKADATRAYAVTDAGLFWLFDFTTGEWLGIFSSGQTTGGHVPTNRLRCAWDPVLSRILVMQQVPDNQDGTCATLIEGFYPVPAPDRLTPPIPLQAPRAGRTVRMYVRAYDHAGVGRAAQPITLEAAAPGHPGTVLVARAAADWGGAVRLPVRCDEAGTDTLTATTEVP